jgi:hypothetical protein
LVIGIQEVIAAAFFGIGEDLIGFVNQLEFLFGIWAAVAVKR